MAKIVNLGKVKGDDATINGVNTLFIINGNGINSSQSGSTMTIAVDADSTPTADSNKPVTSGGVHAAIGGISLAGLGAGTAATLDVASSGDASSSQVVKGDDTRLTDSRNAADVSAWAKASTKPSYTPAEVGAIPATDKGAAGGVATLDNTGKLPSSQLPTLGTAAAKDVAASGDASDTQVVMGNDSRLSDARNAADVYDWAKASTKPSYDYSEIGNTPTLGTAAALNVAATGNADDTEVVKGNDSRLTDSRNAADVYSWAKEATKPSYTASEVGAIDSTLKGAVNGVAELDSNGLVPASQLPSFVDDVRTGTASGVTETAAGTYSATGFTLTGESTQAEMLDGVTYVDTDSNIQYRWTGTGTNLVSMGSNLALGETNMTAYRGDRGKTAYDHSQSAHARVDATKTEASSTNGNIKINGTETVVYTHPGSGTNPHGTTKADVGLGNVGNFKAVSTEASQGLTDTEKANARANIGAGDSDFSGSYNDLSDKPTLGTAAAKDVASSGNASATQVVMGNDSRLSDARNAADVSAWAKASTKPSYTAAEVGLGNVGNFKAVSTEASQGLTATEKTNARANIGAGTSSFSGSYSDLSNKPTLGTAAAKDVASSGNASATQVVMGNDSRLSDARNAADVSAWAKASSKPSYDYSEIGNTPTLGTAAAKDVAASGNASTTQVVMGNDTRLTDARTPVSHTHGNIQNGGTLQTTDVSIASGDKLVVTDSSDGNKVARTSVSFDGSTANKCLTQKGTWESFSNNAGTVTSVKVGTTSYNPTSGVVTIPAYPTTLPASDTVSTYSATGTAPVNGKAVAEALNTLPSPMVFRGSLGTGGTITALPVNGTANIGDTYKVITAGTYASQAAKIGDMFICDTKTSTANTWVYIPSADEPSGTVTSVTLKATSPITIDSSSAITTSGTRTLSHANSGATAGSYGDSAAQTPAYGATFKVPYVTVNATGHVTSISEHTVKIPASDNTDTKVTAVENHYTPATDASSQLSASASGATAAWGIDVVQGVTLDRDAAGHVTGVSVTSGKIPANPNTDTKVRQTLSTANSNLPLLLAYSNNATTTGNVDNIAYRANNIYANPSTGNIQATKLNGVDIGSSPKFTDTTYESKAAASGGTAVSLVTTGEKYTWNNKSTLALGTTSSTAYRGDYGNAAYTHATSDHSGIKPAFTEASSRANIATGETIATIFGKIKKFFTDLKTVAFTGSYNDLSDKPTIPTVNNATLTIQKNGTTVKTFTANASSNVTANITVPTKTSELTNDSNYVTTSGTVAVATTANNIPVNPTSTTGLNIWIET